MTRISRRAWIGAALLLALGAGGAGTYMTLIRFGILRYNRWDRRERGELQVGDAAPDLTLSSYEGSPLRLSSLWADKPLVIVFGSCT